MSSATAATTSAANGGSPAPAPNDAPVTNGNHVATAPAGVPALGTQEPRPPPAPPSAAATPNSKKAGTGKSKKPMDSNETSKLLATRIAQLEHDQAGDKDQAAEIGACLLSSDPKMLLKVVMNALEMGCGRLFLVWGSNLVAALE